MQVVYLADNLFDAHLVKHALEDAGIPAFVFGESLLGGMGELPLFGVLRVSVPDAATTEAQQIISALDFNTADEAGNDDIDQERDDPDAPLSLASSSITPGHSL